MNTKMIYTRRGFVKMAAGAVAAAALVATGASTLDIDKAFAASQNADGSYTVTANLYVKHEDHQAPLVSGNAYLTNPNNPLKLGGFPTSPMSDNATLKALDGGKYQVTIPVRNECFSLIEFSGGDGVTVADYETTYCSYPNENRISSLTLVISERKAEYKFTAVKEYAAHPLKKGYHEWPVYMTVEFPDAQ